LIKTWLQRKNTKRTTGNKDEEIPRNINFNSVEQTLLTCAIAVCMAGIIFVSEGMENPNTPEQAAAKAIIAYMVGAILAFSIVYYGIVFVSEVTGYTPKWLMKIFSDKKTHMHREFEKNSVHHPEHKKKMEHDGGDIEMVSKGKTSSMSEAHLRKLMGENDVLKSKLEKQRKYTEELKKSQKRIQIKTRRKNSIINQPRN
jgi:hypothetical protein